MVRTLLLRGMLAGFLAGLLVFALGRLVGEPPVARAIAFEHASTPHSHGPAATPHAEPEEPVSRATQAGLGLFTGVVVYSTAFGGLFALVFAAADRRLAALGPRGTALLLAGIGFVAVALVPGLKYPANPPAVGAAETIGHRTALFLLMLGVSVSAAVAALALRRRLLPVLGAWNAGLAAGGAYAVAAAAAAWLLPAVNEVPDGFPADLLWQFRLASIAMQLTLWTTLGLVFGPLAAAARPPAYARPANPAVAA